MIDLMGLEFLINSVTWFTSGICLGYLWREAPNADTARVA